MSARFWLNKHEGRLTADSRQTLLGKIAELKDGNWTVEFTPGRKGYTPTRTKYYFDVVLWQILVQAGQFHPKINPRTGEAGRIETTEELHELMKLIYLPQTVQVGRVAITAPGSTQNLSDVEFWDFVEQVMADYANAPYLVEFVDYDTWKAMHKSGEWQEFKKRHAPQET